MPVKVLRESDVTARSAEYAVSEDEIRKRAEAFKRKYNTGEVQEA